LESRRALGHVRAIKQWNWDYGDEKLSKPPRALARYLASRRVYGTVEVQPVLVPSGPGRDPLAGSLAFDSEWGSLSTGRYVITVRNQSSVDLLDVIHAAIALLRRTVDDDDLLLIPLEEEDLPETRVLSSEAFDALARRRLPLHSAQSAPLKSLHSWQ
jgi:hypothetical protein